VKVIITKSGQELGKPFCHTPVSNGIMPNPNPSQKRIFGIFKKLFFYLSNTCINAMAL
jgi:hypothetical protein